MSNKIIISNKIIYVKYIKQKWTELEGEMDKTAVGD